MRKDLYKLTVSIVSLLFLLVSIHHVVSALTTNDFLTYENTAFGIKIQYPSSWEKLVAGVNRIVSHPDDVIFRSPKLSNTSSLPVVFVVSSENISSNLSTYTNSTIKSINENTIGSNITKSKTTIAGYLAYKIVDIIRHKGYNFKVIDIWTARDGIVYRITVYADSKNYSFYSDTIERMITSFIITKPNMTISVKHVYRTLR